MIDYNPFSLNGKTILITGASSGIGRCTAIECSKMGARVIITGRNVERLLETFQMLKGEGHNKIIGDLVNEADVNNLVQTIDPIEGLVLCAGKGMTSPFAFCNRERFDNIFNVNFFAPVELLRLLVKKKKLTKDSSVVFVSSIGGVSAFSVGNSVYGASKAALTSTMKTCAHELAPKRIRVNSVNPGMVNTKLIQGGTLSDEQHQADIERYPLKRYGEPEDVAYGIIYLLSDASSWVTGTCLVIDGGILLV